MSSDARAKATQLDRIGLPGRERLPGQPLFPIHTYPEDVVMADARVVVESVLREKGLLKSCMTSDFRTDYAVQQILAQVEPPTKPRPDNDSRQFRQSVFPE